MNGFWKLYLREKLPAAGLFALCCCIFGVTFRLYGLPLGAVGYPALVCAALLAEEQNADRTREQN